MEKSELKHNKFIKELCESLSNDFTGDAGSIEELLQLNDNEDIRRDFVKKMYKFIEDKKITHYVSAILLGSIEHSEANSRTTSHHAGAQFNESKLLGDHQKHTETKAIQSQEGVVSYEYLPVYSLINKDNFPNFENLFKEATKAYIKRNGMLVHSKPSFLHTELQCST